MASGLEYLRGVRLGIYQKIWMASPTVPCHIAGMGLDIVLLEDKIVSNSLIERQDMRLRDFIHMVLVCRCAPKYMYAK